MSNVLPNSFCIYCSLDSYWAIEAFVSNLSEWYRFWDSSFQSSSRGTTRSVLSGVVALGQVHQPLNPRNWTIALRVFNRLILEPKYHQVPQLGTSHPMVNHKFHFFSELTYVYRWDMNRKFFVWRKVSPMIDECVEPVYVNEPPFFGLISCSWDSARWPAA